MTVTPLEILSLAQTRRTDPDLALRLATEAGQQHTTGWKERPADKEDREKWHRQQP